MTISVRPRALALAGVLVLASLGAVPSAGAADPTYPTGTFTAGPSSQLLVDVPGSTYAYARVSPLALDDDTTSADQLATTMTLDAGTNADGIGPKSVSKCCGVHWNSIGWFVEYREAGVYTPKVTLKDAEGHTTVITLSSITVVRDDTTPTVRIARPVSRLRSTVHGWRTLRGTASDPQMPIYAVRTVVMQLRAGVWFVYDSVGRRWIRGTRSEAGTLTTFGPTLTTTIRDVVENTWSLRLVGLTRGLLVVRATAADDGGSTTQAPVVRSQIRHL